MSDFSFHTPFSFTISIVVSAVPFVGVYVTLTLSTSPVGVTVTLASVSFAVNTGASGFASFTATYTLTRVPSLPWLSTATKVTSYTPAGVVPVVAGKPDTTFTFPVPNGLFSSGVALSSASVTVTKSFNKSAVNVVPES